MLPEKGRDEGVLGGGVRSEDEGTGAEELFRRGVLSEMQASIG